MKDQEIVIELNDYHYTCGDGCCDNYGTVIKVDGEELEGRNTDAGAILKEVLTHLGYTKVKVIIDGEGYY
jgi:hypothetical protein